MAAQSLKEVVIVGRPNVGKSTLFNRLAGKRRALIHDLPGMTRDRLSDVVALDDGRRYELTDTGGLEYGLPVSAEHGAGIDDVVDAIGEIVPPESMAGEEPEDAPVRLAIIGRP